MNEKKKSNTWEERRKKTSIEEYQQNIVRINIFCKYKHMHSVHCVKCLYDLTGWNVLHKSDDNYHQ